MKTAYYKRVVLTDKSFSWNRMPYYVQFSTFETMRDKPITRVYHISTSSYIRLQRVLQQSGFDCDSRYFRYGNLYAVKYGDKNLIGK